ncbi:MAG: zf-HC2 domain-containing protein [Candidatus Eremiobacteraeota bacterium]|nr:zf-HC2 domain-containing protein [Candidatus Eremiobacteraeota bacterium]
MSCSKPEVSENLIMFIEGDLPGEEYERLSAHLAECSDCRKELDELMEVIATIQVSAGHIKEKWIHPDPRTLHLLHFSPGSIEKEKRKQTIAHICACPSCREEYMLLKESPDFVEIEEAESIAEIPDTLIQSYRDLLVKSHESKPIVVGSIKPPEVSLWKRMWHILTPRMKFAYASMAVILLLILATGVIFFGGMLPSERSHRVAITNVDPDRLEEFPMKDASINERENFAMHLRDSGIPVVLKDSKILVKGDRLGVVEKFYNEYQNRIDVAMAESPSGSGLPDFHPRTKGGGTGPMLTGHVTPSAHVAGHSDRTGKGANARLADALDKSIDYPETAPSPRGKAASPTRKAREFKSGITSDSNIFTGESGSTPTPGDSKSKSESKKRIPVGEGDYVNDNTTLANYDLDTSKRFHQSFESLDVKKPTIPASETFKPVEFDDLEERERKTAEVQKKLKKKILGILEDDPTTAKCKVEVFVTLSSKKDQWGEYKARSVTISIEHSQPLNIIEKAKIKERINRKMDWQGLWDKKFNFITPKVGK